MARVPRLSILADRRQDYEKIRVEVGGDLLGKSKMTKPVVKHTVDLLMTAALLLLMSYSLIGETAHEWIGTGMFLLLIGHLILNRRWIGGLGKGRRSVYRGIQTVMAALCFLSMAGLMCSGIILSNHIFAGLRIRGWSALARQMHMVCSYWGFVLMSLHLGLHWSMIAAAIRRLSKVQWLRWLGWLTAAYGVYALWKRGLPGYLFLRTHFVFFDYEEPVLFFFTDYLAIMALFVFCGYGVNLLLVHRQKHYEKEN